MLPLEGHDSASPRSLHRFLPCREFCVDSEVSEQTCVVLQAARFSGTSSVFLGSDTLAEVA